MKTKRSRANVSTGIERICAHNVEWYLAGKDLQLWDSDIDHIQNCLIENYIEGKLCSLSSDGNTVWGWWNIKM